MTQLLMLPSIRAITADFSSARRLVHPAQASPARQRLLPTLRLPATGSSCDKVYPQQQQSLLHGPAAPLPGWSTSPGAHAPEALQATGRILLNPALRISRFSVVVSRNHVPVPLHLRRQLFFFTGALHALAKISCSDDCGASSTGNID